MCLPLQVRVLQMLASFLLPAGPPGSSIPAQDSARTPCDRMAEGTAAAPPDLVEGTADSDATDTTDSQAQHSTQSKEAGAAGEGPRPLTQRTLRIDEFIAQGLSWITAPVPASDVQLTLTIHLFQKVVCTPAPVTFSSKLITCTVHG